MLDRSIELLRKFEPEDGYFGCFSGGKDSVALRAVAELAGVKVEWHYHKTTIDPPELVRFIKEYHPDVIFDRPKYGNFFKRMLKRGFPTRRVRWCCAEYKEGRYPQEAVILMGIRAEESPRRAKNWATSTNHRKTGNLIINPIYNWDSEYLWEFIRSRKVPYCSLYDEGFSRLGCIGCPMAGKAGREKEFARWPQYERKWKKAFSLIWEKRSGSLQRNGKTWFGDAYFDNWEEMFSWWLSDKTLPTKKDVQ